MIPVPDRTVIFSHLEGRAILLPFASPNLFETEFDKSGGRHRARVAPERCAADLYIANRMLTAPALG